MSLSIHTVPALSDNYVYVIHDSVEELTVAVDPSEADPVLEFLNKQNLTLTEIWNTHHHWDHTNGNLAIKETTGCKIVGFEGDAARIPGIDHTVKESRPYPWANRQVHVLEIPGHTSGHIAFYIESEEALFCGDTLFSMGCGRLFEGTPEQMWKSLLKLRSLSDATRIYCGHEYTVKNGQFAASIEPKSSEIQTRLRQAKEMRSKDQPTIPVTIGEEKKTNPFLRADLLDPKDPIGKFAELRALKDSF